jgi:hypothetical protein
MGSEMGDAGRTSTTIVLRSQPPKATTARTVALSQQKGFTFDMKRSHSGPWGSTSKKEEQHAKHEEDEEKNLRDADGSASDAAKAKDGGDKRDDEEGNSPG